MPNYETIKELYSAKRLVHEYRHLYYVDKQGDRTFKVYQVTYSPQEIRILPDRYHNSAQNLAAARSYPDGVNRHLLIGPRKEYISFVDSGGTKRYYWIPESGIRLRPKNDNYVVIDPPLDVSISVSRSLAKEAYAKYADYLDYINGLWDMVGTHGVAYPQGHVMHIHFPVTSVKEFWMYNLYYFKHIHGVTKDTALQKIRAEIVSRELAYEIAVVPDTMMDNTAHWVAYSRLKAAGRLKQFETK